MKSSNLKVSGSIPLLIARLQENEEVINFSSFPRHYVLTDEDKAVKDNSSHILYFHYNIHGIDIFKADSFYKNNRTLNSNDVIERVLTEEVDKSLKNKKYRSSVYYSNQLAHHYLETNYDKNQYTQIIIGMVLDVLLECGYDGFGRDERNSEIIGYDTTLYTRIRAYFNKNNMSEENIKRLIFDTTFTINEKYTRFQTVSEIVVAALNGEDDKMNTLFKNNSDSAPDFPRNNIAN